MGNTAERYRKTSEWIRRRPVLMGILVLLERVLPCLMYAGYPAVLIVLIVHGDPRFWSVLIVPTAVFLLVTILRKRIDRKRPYELPGFAPLVLKERKGESFPSRHAASAAVIAVSLFYLNLWLGAAAAFVAALIAVSRPLCGLHYWSDVIGGILISLCLGIPGILLLSHFGL